MSSEKSIQNKIIKHLKSLPRCWYVKNVATIHSRKGLPDLFVVKDGLFYAFEVKTAVGKPTERQEAELQSMQRAGALTAVDADEVAADRLGLASETHRGALVDDLGAA